ncbi:amino acid permease [Brevibacillus aydinogluensis]|jgi:arginine:ornithine antiporter / lysine permease|uniref:Arginine:ornithine antiporter n=1 Tax=Brevibacillus aydinogluensis TaxID=927786 RepID=A0AA48M7A7_9BACL|nr:amino acid permease [Brevibacillus aydinogluensis]CAJ1002557.1 Arginine:ornithine antiporter [Brevibacillus aydinogluensis]
MSSQKWGFWLLTAFVVGNMVGSGIFMLPNTLVQASSPLAVLFAWLLTGFGVLMIALVFGNLSVRRPDLTAGPQSYARAMFDNPRAGKVAGFSMVWGYWVANWAGNVAVITTFAGYLSAFFPIMQDKTVLFSLFSFPVEKGKFTTFLVCTALLWGFHTLLVRGLNGAGKLNFLSTATKVLGFVLFIVVCLFAFNAANMGDFYASITDENGAVYDLPGQINMAMVATLWAFIGIESAVVLSGRARSQRDVRSATIAGLLISLVLYMGITFLTMGVLPLEQLRVSDKPLVDALSQVIGSTGGIVMAVLAIISLIGSTIGWLLIGAEPPFQAARAGMFPASFAKVNASGSPVRSLTVTNLMSQLFIFSTISGTIAEAYHFVITVATLAILLPYLASAIFQLKLVVVGQTYERQPAARLFDGVVAVLAVLFSLWVIKTGTADMKTLLFGLALYAVGLLLYPVMTPRQTTVNTPSPQASTELQ